MEFKRGKSIFKKIFENLTDPLIQYSSNASYGKTLAGLRQTINNAVGCSITGGYSYHGEINHIKEQYFFGIIVQEKYGV